MKILARQHKQLKILFEIVVMKTRTETELFTDCLGGNEVNLVTALVFYSNFGSLDLLLNLEKNHEMITAICFRVCYKLNRSISVKGERR